MFDEDDFQICMCQHTPPNPVESYMHLSVKGSEDLYLYFKLAPQLEEYFELYPDRVPHLIDQVLGREYSSQAWIDTKKNYEMTLDLIRCEDGEYVYQDHE